MTDPTHTAKLVQARVEHRCHDAQWNNPGCTTIAPGDQYVRSTIFPGHDSGYAGDRRDGRPVSAPLCLPCASKYIDTRGVAATAGRAAS